MHHHRQHTPACPVPPSPALVARFRLSSHGHGAHTEDTDLVDIFNLPHPPGLDDATLFPASHFPLHTPHALITHAAADRAPLRGTINLAVVLVDFPGTPLPTDARQRVQDLLFAPGPRSAGSYFAEASRGKVTGLEGLVVDPVTLPHPVGYYANGACGLGAASPNAASMADEALAKATPLLAPLARFDNARSGYVDTVMFVHAGQGAEQSGRKGDLWSAKWVLPEERVGTDGTRAYAFVVLGIGAPLGVAVHELGHALFGWPDLYDARGAREGVGRWCVMGTGAWAGEPEGTAPVHPGAWCKARQGWVEVVREARDGRVLVEEVKDRGRVHRMWGDGAEGPEYFLLEHRARAGYDAALPGDGLQIWHIDETAVDNTASPRHVALVPAAGALAGNGSPADAFPGSTGKHAFTAGTTPSSRSNGGASSGVALTHITISPDTHRTTADLAVQTFAPVLAQSGLPGACDLRDPADRVFAFDWTHSGCLDHLVVCRPGAGRLTVYARAGDAFAAVFDSTEGIGGCDLMYPADRVFALDWARTGREDHVVVVRPGEGRLTVLAHRTTTTTSTTAHTFVPVFSKHSGLGGWALLDPADQAFALAGPAAAAGARDCIAVVRPGGGRFAVFQGASSTDNEHGKGCLEAVYTMPDSGIGGYAFAEPGGCALALDWAHGGKADGVLVYRPGKGRVVVLAAVRDGATFGFRKAYDHADGLCVYDFASPADCALAFDYGAGCGGGACGSAGCSGDACRRAGCGSGACGKACGQGRADTVLAWRGGEGRFVVATHPGKDGGEKEKDDDTTPGDTYAGTFAHALAGSGLLPLPAGDGAPREEAVALDWAHGGRADHLVFCRPGTGDIVVLGRRV